MDRRMKQKLVLRNRPVCSFWLQAGSFNDGSYSYHMELLIFNWVYLCQHHRFLCSWFWLHCPCKTPLSTINVKVGFLLLLLTCCHLPDWGIVAAPYRKTLCVKMIEFDCKTLESSVKTNDLKTNFSLAALQHLLSSSPEFRQTRPDHLISAIISTLSMICS